MTHLTMAQLVALREPGSDLGDAMARRHLDGCPTCQAELERLHQRVARLKALPTLRPPRDRWPEVQTRLRNDRRRQRRQWLGLGGLVLAASVTLAVVVEPEKASAESAISEAISLSQQLEDVLQSYNPDARVLNGRTERIASALEERIAAIDWQLEMTELLENQAREDASLRLWRERVGLLDALVDVRVTRASNVGL